MCRSNYLKPSILICLLTGLTLSLGCVYRIVTINSVPPGAVVRFGGEEKGPTPVTFEFSFYGTYPVELTKDGYEAFRTTEELKTPAFEYIPFDLVAEILPFRIERKFEFTYQLEPFEPVSDLE